MNLETQNLPTEVILQLAEADRLSFIRKLTDLLRPINELPAFYSTVCRSLAERLRCQCAWLVTIGEGFAEMTIAAEHRSDGAPCMSGKHPIRHLAFLFRALDRQQPFVCTDTGASDALDEPDK
ncbi:MAG TPA: hypothetical protein VHE54_05430, partial [Puia sp.]|nr:hypothetical protein [Puia sp.]